MEPPSFGQLCIVEENQPNHFFDYFFEYYLGGISILKVPKCPGGSDCTNPRGRRPAKGLKRGTLGFRGGSLFNQQFEVEGWFLRQVSHNTTQHDTTREHNTTTQHGATFQRMTPVAGGLSGQSSSDLSSSQLATSVLPSARPPPRVQATPCPGDPGRGRRVVRRRRGTRCTLCVSALET